MFTPQIRRIWWEKFQHTVKHDVIVGMFFFFFETKIPAQIDLCKKLIELRDPLGRRCILLKRKHSQKMLKSSWLKLWCFSQIYLVLTSFWAKNCIWRWNKNLFSVIFPTWVDFSTISIVASKNKTIEKKNSTLGKIELMWIEP